MIMIFGPAGSGKSTQGELLAKELGRKFLSVGQICREQFEEYTRDGSMVPVTMLAKAVMKEVRAAEADGAGVVLDGQPWGEEGIPAMIEAGMMAAIEKVIVLEVPREVCLERLAGRGRSDDRQEVWQKKLDMFEQKIYTFLTGVKAQNVPVFYVDGVGDVGAVGDRMLRVVKAAGE